MMMTSLAPQALWTMVLAAGAGRRLASVTGEVPKQFWSVDASQTLVEQTADRLAPLAGSGQRLTVVDRRHRAFVDRLSRPAALGRIVYQPCDRGTAVGVLFGLHAIVGSAPDAVVTITPSDHAIGWPDLFRFGLRQAAATVGARRAGVILFGVEPDAAASDYGWITPRPWHGPLGSAPIRAVAGFVEKPAPTEALRLYRSGAVWNTMVLVARAADLIDLYRRHLPTIAEAFTYVSHLPPARRDTILADLYPQLPAADFSRDVLTPAEGLTVYTWPATLGWSDLGTPERLERLRRPA